MLNITGYSDEVSGRPGDTVQFMVNCEHASYKADIVRLYCGDTNPAGPGYKEKLVRSKVSGTYKGRRQVIHAGSFVHVEPKAALKEMTSFTVQAMVWPTTPERGMQGIISQWDAKKNAGWSLQIGVKGDLEFRVGAGKGRSGVVSSGEPMRLREWSFVAATFDARTRRVEVIHAPVRQYAGSKGEVVRSAKLKVAPGAPDAPLIMAGTCHGKTARRPLAGDFYNGKIERPRIAGRVLDRAEMAQFQAGNQSGPLASEAIAAWDFSDGIDTIRVTDRSSNHMDGVIINLPARAMTGSNWSGENFDWRHAPDEYGAIHFHDDDLYDAEWDVDFSLTIPDRWESGVYAARIRSGDDEEHIPFVVLAKKGAEKPIAFLLPNLHYMAYANEHMAFNGPIAEMLSGKLSLIWPHHEFLNEHREYGASLYDTHSDGSGVCYSSRLRPILNMRPKSQTQWSCYSATDSNLREFNLDLYIVAWLEKFGFEYDVITDEDLHNDGRDLLRNYRVVITGGHPEYYSKSMRDAVYDFTQTGGRLMYMGGNGFYWRIAMHNEVPGVIEVRRCDAAIKTWEAQSGEYHHSFTGEHGGLWRHQGDSAPQQLTGVGFTAEGFDLSSYYRRTPDSKNPRAKFIFEGIDDEILGDFGYHGGGAAGNELDRADKALGTPPHALVVASSEDHTDLYLLVNEEVLVNSPGLGGMENELVRADMVFFETPGGGAVFSTGSISYAASLPWNKWDNNIAKLTSNVLTRFADPEPFKA